MLAMALHNLKLMENVIVKLWCQPVYTRQGQSLSHSQRTLLWGAGCEDDDLEMCILGQGNGEGNNIFSKTKDQ